MIASRRPSVPHRRLSWSLFFMVAVFVVLQGTSLPSQEPPGDSVEGWTEDQVQEALPVRLQLTSSRFVQSSGPRCAVASSSTQSSSSQVIPFRPGTLRVGPAL